MAWSGRIGRVPIANLPRLRRAISRPGDTKQTTVPGAVQLLRDSDYPLELTVENKGTGVLSAAGVRLITDSASPATIMLVGTNYVVDYQQEKLIVGADVVVTPTLLVEGASLGAEQFGLLYRGAARTRDTNKTWRLSQAITGDATPTTLDTISIAASRTYLLESHVTARRYGGGGAADDGAAYVLRVMVTTKAGTVTLGAINAAFTSEDVAALACTYTVSGTNVLLQVTGDAATNYLWDGVTSVQWTGSV